MFKLFNFNHSAFGLDISSSSFKLVYLKPGKQFNEMAAYADVAVPKGAVSPEGVADPTALAYLIKEAVEKPQFGKLDTRYVNVSLPESKCFVRVIQTPVLKEEEIGSAVPFEAESFIPLPLDQVYLDYEVIGESQGKLNVLIAASPKDFVDKYLEFLDKTGLIVSGLEVESLALRRALVPAESNETLLITDIDALRTNFVVVEDGSVQFASTVAVAGHSFTEAVAKALGVQSVKAEEVKKKIGIANSPEYPNLKTALVPVLANLCSEIENIVKFHMSHSSRQIDRIILSGGSGRLINLPEYLSMELTSVLSVPVETGKPLSLLTDLAPLSMDDGTALSFATAIGLAKKNIFPKKEVSGNFSDLHSQTEGKFWGKFKMQAQNMWHRFPLFHKKNVSNLELKQKPNENKQKN